MSENKISVSQYLENEDLLEINYVPYDVKREIVETIISKTIFYKDMLLLDTALLNRISCEIFIESITNIDMNILDEHGLYGYDTLCMNNALNNLLVEINDEYERFMEILEYKVNDFIRKNNSTGAIISSVINRIVNWSNYKIDELNNYIEGINVKKVANELKILIDKNLEKYKDK